MMIYFSLHLLNHQGDPLLLALQLPLEGCDIPALVPEEMHDLIRKELSLHHPLQVLAACRVHMRIAKMLAIHDNYRQ